MRIIIVGAGYAGLAAALRLARKGRGKAKITLISPNTHFVERIRLHQIATGQSPKTRALAHVLRGTGIRLITGWVDDIDIGAKTLLVDRVHFNWDRLVLAMGSHISNPFTHAIALNPENIGALKTHLFALSQTPNRRVAIVGAGLTGIEAATEIAETWPHISVSLISSSPALADWSMAARQFLGRRLRQLGVEVQTGVQVTDVSNDHVRTAHQDIPADLTIWTAGFGFSDLPHRTGLAVNSKGQMLVDPFLRSRSHPHIYAVGDLAAPIIDPGDVLPLGCKSALPTGAYVGDSLAGGLLGTAPRDLMPFDYRGVFFCVSLGRRAGLVQWMRPTGEGGRTEPKGRVITGKVGAAFKEMVCKGTWISLVGEAHGLAIPMGLRSGHPPKILPHITGT